MHFHISNAIPPLGAEGLPYSLTSFEVQGHGLGSKIDKTANIEKRGVDAERSMSQSMVAGRIRAGMGGWNYEPWRKTFYPKHVSKNQELHYASRQVTAIEINGTFYRLQSPAVFAKWRAETPDDFVFSLKAPRFLVNRRDLRTAAAGLPRFIDSGLSQLQTKLGPVLWQLAPTKPFDAAEVDDFLGMLPREVDGVPLRHAFEVRHESFMTPEYLQIARKHRVATVFADTDEHPSFADVTADFIYARLMRTVSSEPTGYARTSLATWAKRAGQWASGEDASSLPRVEKVGRKEGARDVFMFFISGAKERAPAAAQHLLTLLDPKSVVVRSK